MHHTNPREPVYFWRRLIAFVVDYLLLAVLVSLIFAPIIRGHTDRIRLAISPINAYSCYPGRSVSPEMVELVQRDRFVKVTYCNQRVLGIDNGFTAKLLLVEERWERGGTTFSKTVAITVPIDREARPVRPVSPDIEVFLALFIIASAWAISRPAGQTPGKYLLGLRVVNASRPRALRREFFRLAPFVALVLLGDLLSLFTGNGFLQTDILAGLVRGSLWSFLIFAFLGFAFFLWYFLLPLFTGPRLARWDRWAGTRITRL